MTTAESDILRWLRAWLGAGTLSEAGWLELIAAWTRSAESDQY